MTTAAQPARAEESLWRPMVQAMGKTGGASIAGGLLGALATKIVAATLGPGSIALLATLQQLREGAVTVATANGKTALLQGASALRGIERREYLRTVALLFAGGTMLVAAAMMLYPESIARWSKLTPTMGPLLPWLAATVALLSVFVFLTSILNALLEIGTLALLQVASPLAAAMVAWPLAWEARKGHPVALVLFLAIPAALSAGSAAVALRGHAIEDWFRGSGRWFSADAARHFFSISGAMLVSGVAATAVLLAVRGSITRADGLAMTGQFDAAWNISMNQVTLILGSVMTYYFPTLAAGKTAEVRGRHIQRMLIVATLATVPLIVALIALKPLAVKLLYSSQFALSPQFLRWTLVGDYLKVGSWVLAAPMLATRDVGMFLVSDLTTNAIFFSAALLLAQIVRPAEAAAMGFLISYGAYFVFCYGYARSRHAFHFGVAGLTAWLTGLALILAASASAWADTSVHIARAGCWIALSIGFSVAFAVYFRRREA